MLVDVARYWWVFVLRGALAVLFGLAAFVWPGLTAAVLVLFMGAWFLVDGVLTLVEAARSSDNRGMRALYGLISLLAGVAAISEPVLAMVAVTIVIGVWAIFKGVLEISAAIRLRRELEGEWLLILAGAVSIVFGGAVIMRPDAGLMAIVWILGLYAIVFGALLLSFGYRVRGLVRPAPNVTA